MVVFRRFLLLLMLGVLCLPLMADILTPVHWSTETKDDSIVLTANIDKGWHMTLISIGDSTIGEEYENQMVLSLPLTEEGIAVRYNACDDTQCTAPDVFNYAQSCSPNHESPIAQPSSRSPYLLFWWGLLGGLLAIFTPCVWPIIPMTVSFFLRQDKNRGVRNAVLFGLSIIVIYVGLGLLLTAVFGAAALNQLATNAIVNLFFFALLVVFSLSFFGLFEITLPSSWGNRIDNRSRQLSSVFLMAFTLVIVSFSCTGPIIGTLLVEAASQSWLAPAVGMLGFAIALALPFALLALFPDWMQRLPKSGDWMQSLKVSLAFFELAFSLKFLSVADMAYGWGILPRWLFIALWIVCFAGMGIYLLRKSWVGKVIGIASCLFALYLIPGLWGAPVKGIAAFAPPLESTEEVYLDYESGLAEAQRTGKPVLLQFTGYGCVNCRKMEQYILEDAQIQEKLKDYVHIILYVDSRQDENNNQIVDGNENSRLQQERFHSNAQPFWVLLAPDGTPMGEPMTYTTDIPTVLQWLQHP